MFFFFLLPPTKERKRKRLGRYGSLKSSFRGKKKKRYTVHTQKHTHTHKSTYLHLTARPANTDRKKLIDTLDALREAIFHGLDQNGRDGFVGRADGDAEHLKKS